MLDKISKYDFNVWGASASEVHLVAYPQVFDKDEGYIITDYSNEYILELKYPKDYASISYMFDTDDVDAWLEEYGQEELCPGFTDYDEWPSPEYMLEGNTPEKIIKWLESLPDYEIGEK